MPDETVSRTTVSSQDPVTNTATTKTVVSRNGAFADFFVSKTNQVIFSIIAIIDLLILLRLIFLLLGANRVGIVNFILNLTQIFVAPFMGIFPSPSVEGAYLETASIMAIIIWAVFGYILSLIIGLFGRDSEV